MKILVTGAAGFIGTNLVNRLLTSGHMVIGVDNFITGSINNIKPLLANKNFHFVKLDITHSFPKSLNSQNSTLGAIYHLACPTGVPNLGPLAEEMILTCSIGTRNVLEIAKISGAKLVFTSSSEVYGDPQVFPQEETYSGNVHPTGFRSPYEEGKRFSESLILVYNRKYKVDAKIVRVFNTYGPNMSETDTRVIPKFIRQSLKKIPLTVEGEGAQKRTFCYADDLVDGLIAVMDKGESGGVYNLGSDYEVSIIELANLILKMTGNNNQIKFIERPTHDHQRRLPALKRSQQIGWQPKIGLEQGLAKTLQSLS